MRLVGRVRLAELQGRRFVNPPHYEPRGTKFLGTMLSGDRGWLRNEVMLVTEDESRPALRGWILYRHPDGQWVSLRKATDPDFAALDAAGVRGSLLTKPGLFGIVPDGHASCERCLKPRMAASRFCADCAKNLRMEMGRAGYLEPHPPTRNQWEFLRSRPTDQGRMRDGFEMAHPELRRDERDYT